MRCSFVICLFLTGYVGCGACASIAELPAGDDGFYHRPDFVVGCSESGLDVCEEDVIGWLECPSEGIRCEFASEGIEEVLLSLAFDVFL